MKTDLIAACQMFLGPITILFAALGLASTEGLKAGISAVGATTSFVWFVQVFWWEGLSDLERYNTAALALTFVVALTTSFVYHGREYFR